MDIYIKNSRFVMHCFNPKQMFIKNRSGHLELRPYEIKKGLNRWAKMFEGLLFWGLFWGITHKV